MIVSFTLYTDTQGLGAENCRLADEVGPTPSGGGATSEGSAALKSKPKASSITVGESDSQMLKAKPKMAADSGAASALKAKPKMSAGGGIATKSSNIITIPGHLNPALAHRLVSWMWDKGG